LHGSHPFNTTELKLVGTVSLQCRCIEVRGSVQGVGFRPFVYRLATRHGLNGWVCNQTAGVQIVIEGTPEVLDGFVQDLQRESPPLARIDQIHSFPKPTAGFEDFQIRCSSSFNDDISGVPVDSSICDACLRELFDPDDRRYRYPFINCTNCGPRFTIIESMPYDRHRTTMAMFSMCPDCQREYDDPQSRRFHAQPNACPGCGPTLSLVDSSGDPLTHTDPIAFMASKLAAGDIAAVKGLGGFHLAVDATNDQAVQRLRLRKNREEKPFAVMVRDLETARSLCDMDEAEEQLLACDKRPIVLLHRRSDIPIAESVAPGLRELGVMLAYTPLHNLLLAEFESATNRLPVFVMTSGNLRDEPIAYRNKEALDHLKVIADYFLTHDRSIQTRCEDSVTRVIEGEEVLVRRARGYAPDPIKLPFQLDQPVLAVGPHLKNAFCLGMGQNALLSPHVGDLENYPAYQSFLEGIQHFQNLFGVAPTVIAHDLHPDYLSTQHALEQEGMQLIGVQHHHAHIASVMAEHGLQGSVIGVAFDGTGHGTDGRIWGGEFLIADYRTFQRVAHLQYVPLPGGEQAVREPWRMAAVYLSQSHVEEVPWRDGEFARLWPRFPWIVIQQMIAADVNCPLASSMGRLFDAVSSLLTGRLKVAYEGQAAIELEMLVEPNADVNGYRFSVDDGTPRVIDPKPVIRAVVNDRLQGIPIGLVAARFHESVVNLIVETSRLLRDQTGLDRVALSGGVFQNRTLLRQSLNRLRQAGFQVYTNHRVPPNDGGISLGQLAAAKWGGF
jgi:hydrogenase maturation protein HypF